MASRIRLQENMENMARRRQKEYEQQSEWMDKINYYKHWDKQNNRYGNWTSDEYYKNSLSQYDIKKKKEEKEEWLAKRREKLRQLLVDEDNEYHLEILDSPRDKKINKKSNEVPTAVLREINIGLKLAEEDKRRHEAELKLYQQWRNENPIIREYESNQNRSSLKLAWLDQQIEKRMAQEKSEEETRRMIEERDRFIQEEQKLERKELEQRATREKELMEQIENQMQAYKINENRFDKLLGEEELAIKKKWEVEEMIEKRNKEIENRKQKDLLLFNINQSKMKLRKKAIEVEEQLRKERQIIEDIQRSRAIEAVENEEQKKQTKKAMDTYLNYVKEQQRLEHQRQEFISFIFDSEAKSMWQKQERLWIEEQATRDKLLENVLLGLKQQIQEKIDRNSQQRLYMQKEREERMKTIEELDMRKKEEQVMLEKRKYLRRMELDKQINDQRLLEKEKELEEQKRKREELEKIRKEEERLKNELMQMQRGKYHPSRFNRRNILW